MNAGLMRRQWLLTACWMWWLTCLLWRDLQSHYIVLEHHEWVGLILDSNYAQEKC